MPSALLVAVLALALLTLLFKRTRTLHEAIFPELYEQVGFPEHRYLPRDRDDYARKAAKGYARMKEVSVVICGITRNDAETLPLTKRRIEKTGSLFKDYRVIVYENDSIDDTLPLLRDWESCNRKVRVLSGVLVGTPWRNASRIEILAYCRNQYLDALSASHDYDGFDYVMVVDFDLGGGWSDDGIATTMALSDWDAVGSNSIGYHYLRKTYYDTAALRPHTVCARKWRHVLFGEGWQWRRNDAPIAVHSAFGGLALYAKAKLLSARYADVVNGEAGVEHLSLNADRSWRFYLNPSQITVVGTQERKSYRAEPSWQRTTRKLLFNW